MCLEEDEIGTARSLLSEQLLSYLGALSPELRADVIEALSADGKLFHRPALPLDGRWALLPLFLARALNVETEDRPDPACISGAALAVECMICALDLFDDVMDEDATSLIERSGTARVLNAALTLISLPQRILLSLVAQDRSTALPLHLLEEIQRALLLAAAGQQRDLLAEKRSACEMSREDCLEIAATKAGSLLSLACRLGALCAGVEETLIERCAEMGRLLGIAAQLDNDAHDLSHLLRPVNGHSQKSDLRRGKKTLPVVLAAHALREMHALEVTEIDEALREIATLTSERREAVLSALRAGILTTWGISLLYRERARDCFGEIVEERSISEALLQVLGFEETPATGKDW